MGKYVKSEQEESSYSLFYCLAKKLIIRLKDKFRRDNGEYNKACLFLKTFFCLHFLKAIFRTQYLEHIFLKHMGPKLFLGTHRLQRSC